VTVCVSARMRSVIRVYMGWALTIFSNLFIPPPKFLKTVKKSQGLVKEYPLSMGRCNFMIFFIVIEISHKKTRDLKKRIFQKGIGVSFIENVFSLND
jgi:hypothetical protein